MNDALADYFGDYDEEPHGGDDEQDADTVTERPADHKFHVMRGGLRQDIQIIDEFLKRVLHNKSS